MLNTKQEFFNTTIHHQVPSRYSYTIIDGRKMIIVIKDNQNKANYSKPPKVGLGEG